jgi:hypothetical protein
VPFNLSNYVISFIRTYVPIWVGTGLVLLQNWLNDNKILWIHVDSVQAVAWATALVISIYYGLVRLAEKKWPKIGILLGHAAKPVYVEPAPTDGGI